MIDLSLHNYGYADFGNNNIKLIEIVEVSLFF